MRIKSVKDCKLILKKFNIDPSSLTAIDVGGTEVVNLNGEFVSNPLFKISPKLVLLDQGFNIETIGTKADEVIDFLDIKAIEHLREKFEMVYCFDTLEHVPNPFLFCENLIYITKPGSYIFLATVFNWSYHPSPEDYFRFSPKGLWECFKGKVNKNRDKVKILWCDWGSDKRGFPLLIGDRRRDVVLLAQRLEK